MCHLEGLMWLEQPLGDTAPSFERVDEGDCPVELLAGDVEEIEIFGGHVVSGSFVPFRLMRRHGRGQGSKSLSGVTNCRARPVWWPWRTSRAGRQILHAEAGFDLGLHPELIDEIWRDLSTSTRTLRWVSSSRDQVPWSSRTKVVISRMKVVGPGSRI